VDRHIFLACETCGLIQLDAHTLARIDSGEAVFKYADGYWASEMVAARERAFGIAMARTAEVFLYCRRPIRRFLDVGTGPGTFLDAVAAYLPHVADRFRAVERFPPPEPERTQQANYRIGRVGDYPPESFDAGLCIEVFEHLTPNMVDRLLAEIASVSRADACFLVNTGLADYTRDECPAYLDPIGRGHITIWTVLAVNHLARRHGLVATAVPGRSWCFLLEKANLPRPSTEDRAATALSENRSSLQRPDAGASPVGLLGEVALREAFYYDQFLKRSRWAMALDDEVGRLRHALAAAPVAPAACQDGGLAAEVTALRADLAAIHASRSWRVTAGLRFFSRLVRHAGSRPRRTEQPPPHPAITATAASVSGTARRHSPRTWSIPRSRN